ncbi:asparagine synthase (glutamine-hydrolyzing) [Poseidonibacter ostreae]|uniref:asparagine synthase (glutamine-hydrolyzing) n=1 Tax=Poseidonibacter ostreae TaxID=2654171 RepID=A0A6L4WUT2_9BACT|nr:asparagine synthase (glutamine-hydrolyzing) [Poseidonibacter ostreae]KAB7889878.1 asparagine synthase (glutamine-hydrolyzing) [Poseidonibacter ostreae]KAB7890199.1 asparagine synthase (glutamine-hydrolyzing) [Poseidonibacter ostreae]
MCGISGIINTNNKTVEKIEIEKINRLISHRGPDDEGYFYRDNFAFGHRRLSILDLSSDGHQPMNYKDEKYTITYNGEIYNYIELKNELSELGYNFNSNTDTEVILASYDKWGDDCVSKFNGMWAFSIYDREKEILFCSRDRFGIKPFYYAEVENKFVFGSEIKQLLPFYESNYVNKTILMDYLILGYEAHTNETFFKNIFQLEQGHILKYNLKNHSYVINRFYDINESSLNSEEDESIESYKSALERSINLRLRSDVKVGTCLSGGLDSSSIASLAAKQYKDDSGQKFTAIHAKSSQKSNDESEYAKIVSEHCDLDLNIVEPTEEDFIKHIDEVIYTQEEPFGSPSIFMQYFVMKKAREIGCTVMLDGQGGDETLLGYERYYSAYLISLGFWKSLQFILNSSKNSKLSIKQLIMYFIYFTNSKIRLGRLKKKNSFISSKYFDMVSKEIVEENAKNYLKIFNLQRMEIFKTQMPHLLKYEDRNSMKHSIEARLPFIDYNVLETALNIDNNFKIKQGWTKYILRKTIEKLLPDNVVWRKNKCGFEAPSSLWLKSIEADIEKSIFNSKIIKEITTSIDIKKLDNKTRWRLFNISKWEALYNVKID